MTRIPTMDPVDQGTLAMLLVGGVMALVATMYFSVRWYFKRKAKSPPTKKERKKKLKQTFSRFSQVDEELTVQVFHEPTEFDRELIQSYRESEMLESPPVSPRIQPMVPRTPSMALRIQTVSLEVDAKMLNQELSQTRVSPQTSRPSYLETDL